MHEKCLGGIFLIHRKIISVRKKSNWYIYTYLSIYLYNKKHFYPIFRIHKYQCFAIFHIDFKKRPFTHSGENPGWLPHSSILFLCLQKSSGFWNLYSFHPYSLRLVCSTFLYPFVEYLQNCGWTTILHFKKLSKKTCIHKICQTYTKYRSQYNRHRYLYNTDLTRVNILVFFFSQIFFSWKI